MNSVSLVSCRGSFLRRGWGYEWGNGPAWDSAYLIIPWEMYRYYGDKRILEQHFDRFKRYVDYHDGKSQ